MLDDLEWPPLQQRRASRLALFHLVNRTVDIDSAVLMEESRRPSRKAGEALIKETATNIHLCPELYME